MVTTAKDTRVDRRRGVAGSAPASPARAVEPLVRLERVSKSYGQAERVVALDRVTLDIRPGELLVVLGPSGSGKTTLIQVASGLMSPDQGIVVVGGRRLDLRKDKAVSKLRNERMGFVFQKAHFVSHLSVRENVELPMTIAGIRPRVRRRRAQRCLDSVGLGGLGGRRVGELSGGQQQRVSIARALCRRPELLFADEPTGNLDTARGRGVVDTLTALVRDERVGVVLVTHNEAFASTADRVVRMLDGTLTEVARAGR